jgi:protein gp37
MAETTAISWCDSSFNPWLGCSKVSPACDHCYAERLMDTRMHKVQWGSGNPRKRTSPANWRQPLLWEREHEAFELMHGRRRRVFCASLADVFDNAVDPQWRADLFALIAQTPHLDWLLLTKRIGNAKAMLGDYKTVPMLPNIWLGATVCNQEEANRDVEKLLETPARLHFVSYEPALGELDLMHIPIRRSGRDFLIGSMPENAHINALHGFNDNGKQTRIDWVICGGESGPNARPMHPEWVRSLRDQCAAAGVQFHFKQWGEWAPDPMLDPSKVGGWDAMACTVRVGTKAAGRLLDGIEHNGFPAQ